MKNIKITAIDIITVAIGVIALVFITLSMFITTQPYLMIGMSFLAVATVINVIRLAKGYNKPKKEN